MCIVGRILAWRGSSGSVLKDRRRAELALVFWHQSLYFSEVRDILLRDGRLPVTHRLAPLAPFLDDPGEDRPLIRLGGRIKAASHLTYEARCPLLLDPEDVVVERLARYFHSDVLEHCGGANTLLSKMRSQYWPVRPVALARRITRSCVICLSLIHI